MSRWGGYGNMKDMGKFPAVVVTWLMVLVALGQGGPGGPGGPGGGMPGIAPVAAMTDWMGNEPATDKDHFPAQLPAVEGNTVTVVFDKGGSAQVQLFFTNLNPNTAFVGQLIVEDARYIHDTAPLPAPWGSPPPVTIPDTILSVPAVPLTIGIGQTAPVTLTISGLPPFVTKGHIQFQMRAEGNFGWQPVGSNVYTAYSGVFQSQKVLVTYAPPTGVMVPVWTEVAEISCTMAQGETTIGDVNKELTRGLFGGGLFMYNLWGSVSSNYYRGGELSTDFGEYNLKNLLNDFSVPGIETGNCYDVNGFLLLLHESQGVEASARRIRAEFYQPYVTNLACPIGFDSSQDSMYMRAMFTVHYQAVVMGGVSDSALAYKTDLGGSIFKLCPYSWSLSGSWQSFVPVQYHGLTFRLFLGNEDTIVPHGVLPYSHVDVGPTQSQFVPSISSHMEIIEVK